MTDPKGATYGLTFYLYRFAFALFISGVYHSLSLALSVFAIMPGSGIAYVIFHSSHLDIGRLFGLIGLDLVSMGIIILEILSRRRGPLHGSLLQSVH